MKAVHITDLKQMKLKLDEIIKHELEKRDALEDVIDKDPDENPFDDNNTKLDVILNIIGSLESAAEQMESAWEDAEKYEADP